MCQFDSCQIIMFYYLLASLLIQSFYLMLISNVPFSEEMKKYYTITLVTLMFYDSGGIVNLLNRYVQRDVILTVKNKSVIYSKCFDK